MATLKSVLFDLDAVTSTVNRIHATYVPRSPRMKSYSPPRNYFPPVYRKESEEIQTGG
jgi:hypothetical protein